MRRLIALSVAILLLTGCGSSGTVDSSNSIATANGKVPVSCEIVEVISAFDAQVPGSKFVPTDWQPFPGTDLDAALSNQGIACTYGIEVAEVGGTILWASNSSNIWQERKPSWIEAGQIPIDLPGIQESAAYILQDGTSADEMHVWRVNLLINEVWIQVGASFLQNLDEALPIIKAAISVTES